MARDGYFFRWFLGFFKKGGLEGWHRPAKVEVESLVHGYRGGFLVPRRDKFLNESERSSAQSQSAGKELNNVRVFEH